MYGGSGVLPRSSSTSANVASESSPTAPSRPSSPALHVQWSCGWRCRSRKRGRPPSVCVSHHRLPAASSSSRARTPWAPTRETGTLQDLLPWFWWPKSWRATPWCRSPRPSNPFTLKQDGQRLKRVVRHLTFAGADQHLGRPAVPVRGDGLLGRDIETLRNSPPKGTLGVFSFHEQLSHCGCGRATWHRIDAGLATKAWP